MKIAISAESTVDLSKELIEKFDVKIIPLEITLGDRTDFDGVITCDEIIQFVNENNVLPKTGAANEFRFIEYFEEIRKEYDAIIHVSLSSELSCTYQNAVSAAQKVGGVYVVNSKSLSTGIALLVLYARKLVDKGLDAEEIYEKVCARVDKVQASFVLKRLDYLHKGGRCSSIAYLGANIFKIRPQIIVTEGKMISGKKFKGDFAKVVKEYATSVLEEFNNPDTSVVFITYTTADQQIIDDVTQMLKDYGFEDVYITRAGGTITSHCGENCLGVLYINDGKQD